MIYFGERENGPPARDQEAITPATWHGIVGLIQAALSTGRFAEDFPDRACVDPGMDGAITGANEKQFYARLKGDHPNVEIPLNPDRAPETIQALEVVEFCHRHVSMPVGPDNHDHFAHQHYLHFSRERGQEDFAREINTI